MTNTENHSRTIARILDTTAAREFEKPITEIGPAFDAAEATCLALASSEELKLEVRRRVAEWKMMLLCDHNAPFSTVEKLHDNVLIVGYTNLEREGSIEIYFALYCERQARIDNARHILRQLYTKLDTALKSEGLEVYRSLKESAEKILLRIGEGKSTK